MELMLVSCVSDATVELGFPDCDCAQVGGRAKYVPDVDGFVFGTVSVGLVRTIFKCSWSNLHFRGVD